MALRDQHEAGDAAGIPLVAPPDLDQAGLDQLGHAELVRQPVEPSAHDLRIAEPSRLAAVAVEGQVPTEPAPPLAIRLAIPQTLHTISDTRPRLYWPR